MSGHEVNHIQNPLVPECSLFRILRPEPFQWHVDQCHQNISSKNQSRPIAGPSRRVWFMGTLDPPNSVAAVASDSPVNAKTFFLRRIEEMTPNKSAPTMRH